MKRSEFIEKWLEALESGKYKQTKSILKNGNRYCCLGVACELKGLDFEKDTDYQLLPKNLARFMGITEDGGFKYPVLHRNTYYKSLADLNDNGVKFKTIARIIREQIENKNFEKLR